MDTRNARFFRWYRVLPLLCIALMLALSLGIDYLPKDVVRGMFFPVSYAQRIDDAAKRYDVDEHLVAAVIRCESGWNENAQSVAGAVGLMQIMPETARSITHMNLVDTAKYDANNLTDPATNIEYGTAYLSYLQSELSNTDEVIAAYNAGLGAVQGWMAKEGSNGIPDAIEYPETRHYVERVNEALRQYTKYYPNGMSTL
ncbi:MAG: lytic transglycosylase domain-containing protein [Coriobacteriales bacterium]|nr:lytic transglycosylase domain-containing protein [Coriobacteriales bacterium]